jgi:lipopolysaccharide/colanic/teichoic acid biosynthesis glycosyltransferase
MAQPIGQADHVADLPDTFYVRRGKRLFDVVVGSVAAISLAPLMLITTVFGIAALGMPVLFRQVRVGCSGERFVMLKLRSMHHDRRLLSQPIEHPDRRLTHKSIDDPRHTGYGRFIRGSSIDELAQIFNVIRGDMSIVGPRPELPEVAEEHGLIDHVRHVVRPGLTGMWQISADRPGFVHENVVYDEIYVKNVSFWTDIKIIVKTIPVLVRGSGC